MTAARSFISVFFALAIAGGFAAATPACVIQATDCDECNEEGVCDSHLGDDGMCYCDPGHVWEDPNDPNNFACDEIPSHDGACDQAHNVQVGGDCFCECGWNWCNDDPSDLSCCPDDSSDCQESDTEVLSTGSGDSSSGSGSSSGSDTGSGSGSSGSDSGSAGSESGSSGGSGSSGSGEGSGTADGSSGG